MATPNTTTLDAPDVAPDRALCDGCERDSPPGRILCMPCTDRIPALLERIRHDYGRLELHPGRHGADGSRPPVGFMSKPPCSIPALSLQAPPARVAAGGHVPDLPAVTSDSTGAGDPDNLARAGDPTLVVLGRVADRCREYGLVVPSSGRPSVYGLAWALQDCADGIAAAWWAGSALRALRRAARDLQRALGEDEVTIPLGECPRIAPEWRAAFDASAAEHGDGAARAQADELAWWCAGTIRSRSYGHAARCSGCGHVWRGTETLRRLGESLGDAFLDLPSIARYLDGFRDPNARPATAEALRKRAAREGWATRRAGRRTLYRLSDARESAWRAWDRAHPVQGPDLPAAAAVAA